MRLRIPDAHVYEHRRRALILHFIDRRICSTTRRSRPLDHHGTRPGENLRVAPQVVIIERLHTVSAILAGSSRGPGPDFECALRLAQCVPPY